MPEPRWIFCAGMIRAGSTLQYQLASEIVERGGLGRREPYAPESEFPGIAAARGPDRELRVFKAHVCTPELQAACVGGEARVIYCYRDIRDVAVSAQRKFGFASFEAMLEARWLDQALADYRAWTATPDVHIARYESMAGDVAGEALAINAFLGAPLSEADSRALGGEFGFERQRERVAAVATAMPGDASGSHFDAEQLLHHNHLHNGEIGAWRTLLTPAQKAALDARFGSWLQELGYPID